VVFFGWGFCFWAFFRWLRLGVFLVVVLLLGFGFGCVFWLFVVVFLWLEHKDQGTAALERMTLNNSGQLLWRIPYGLGAENFGSYGSIVFLPISIDGYQLR